MNIFCFSNSLRQSQFPIVLILLCLTCTGCDRSLQVEAVRSSLQEVKVGSTSLIVLGTIQDAGSPHIACAKDCCKGLFDSPDPARQVVSLGLIDGQASKSYLFDASPDISRQMKVLKSVSTDDISEIVDGIFLTHAHIGHYTGLMYLGKEACDAKGVDVYAMPRMQSFLTDNGPWSQLVSRGNIELQALRDQDPVLLSDHIVVTPYQVPHRDEYSETVGFHIEGPSKSALYIPDIDKWDRWKRDIVEEIKAVDYAFLDATFYSGAELNNRDISQIPHPFIIESFERFEILDRKERQKVVFIHFNHTNPVINIDSEEAKEVMSRGFSIAQIGDVYQL